MKKKYNRNLSIFNIFMKNEIQKTVGNKHLTVDV